MKTLIIALLLALSFSACNEAPLEPAGKNNQTETRSVCTTTYLISTKTPPATQTIENVIAISYDGQSFIFILENASLPFDAENVIDITPVMEN